MSSAHLFSRPFRFLYVLKGRDDARDLGDQLILRQRFRIHRRVGCLIQGTTPGVQLPQLSKRVIARKQRPLRNAVQAPQNGFRSNSKVYGTSSPPQKFYRRPLTDPAAAGRENHRAPVRELARELVLTLAEIRLSL